MPTLCLHLCLRVGLPTSGGRLSLAFKPDGRSNAVRSLRDWQLKEDIVYCASKLCREISRENVQGHSRCDAWHNDVGGLRGTMKQRISHRAVLRMERGWQPPKIAEGGCSVPHAFRGCSVPHAFPSFVHMAA